MKLNVYSILLACCIGSVQFSEGQEKLAVKRGGVSNFLKDQTVVLPKGRKQLDSVFQIVLPSTGQTLYWSSEACRLIGIKNGEKTTLTELEASGAHPLARSIGAVGTPKFFGLRIVDNGLPEFLYSIGQLSIEEKLQFSPDGKRLLQTVKIQSGAIQGNYVIPENWREVITGDNGRWSGNTLRLTNAEMQEGFTFTFHLDPNEPKPSNN